VRYRREFLQNIENIAKERYKDRSNLECLLKEIRTSFHDRFGSRLYNLCKKGANGKLTDENLIINFLFDAAINGGEYNLISNDPDIGDQLFQLYNKFKRDKASYSFAIRFKDNPTKYKAAKPNSRGEFGIPITNEEVNDLLNGGINLIGNRLLIKIGNDLDERDNYYLGRLTPSNEGFLKIKGETGKNTDLFGDLDCNIRVFYGSNPRNVEYCAYFLQDSRDEYGISRDEKGFYLFKDWAHFGRKIAGQKNKIKWIKNPLIQKIIGSV